MAVFLKVTISDLTEHRIAESELFDPFQIAPAPRTDTFECVSMSQKKCLDFLFDPGEILFSRFTIAQQLTAGLILGVRVSVHW